MFEGDNRLSNAALGFVRSPYTMWSTRLSIGVRNNQLKDRSRIDCSMIINMYFYIVIKVVFVLVAK